MKQLQSESVKEIFPSMVKAIGGLKNTGKTTEGYGYKYAELGALIDDSRDILMQNGLFISQVLDDDENGQKMLITTLGHSSGEWIRSYYILDAVGMAKVNAAQQMGAAITYARRYSLAAILNIAQADDDAQSVQSTTTKKGVVRTNNKQVNNSTAPASLAQIGFLKTLLTEKGFTIQNYLEQKVLSSESEITSQMASESINKMKS
jgi:hypothetical protein